MNQPATLGYSIRDARIAKGLSQEQLAALTGRSKSFMSDIESGRHTPGYPTLIRIASVLELQPDNLIQMKYEEDRERRLKA